VTFKAKQHAPSLLTPSSRAVLAERFTRLLHSTPSPWAIAALTASATPKAAFGAGYVRRLSLLQPEGCIGSASTAHLSARLALLSARTARLFPPMPFALGVEHCPQ